MRCYAVISLVSKQICSSAQYTNVCSPAAIGSWGYLGVASAKYEAIKLATLAAAARVDVAGKLLFL